MNVPNRQCPVCAANGHDNTKDHLYLMGDGGHVDNTKFSHRP